MPAGVVYVGRPSRWGNPWRVEQLADPVRVAVVRRELGGRDLACWCRLDAVCHADVLLAVANPPAVAAVPVPGSRR
jgi:hypothetical protein